MTTHLFRLRSPWRAESWQARRRWRENYDETRFRACSRPEWVVVSRCQSFPLYAKAKLLRWQRKKTKETSRALWLMLSCSANLQRCSKFSNSSFPSRSRESVRMRCNENDSQKEKRIKSTTWERFRDMLEFRWKKKRSSCGIFMNRSWASV